MIRYSHIITFSVLLLLVGCAHPRREDLAELPQASRWNGPAEATGAIQVNISPEHPKSPAAGVLEKILTAHGYAVFREHSGTTITDRNHVTWIIEPQLEMQRSIQLEKGEYAYDQLILFAVRPMPAIKGDQLVRYENTYFPCWGREILRRKRRHPSSSALYEQACEALIANPEFRELLKKGPDKIGRDLRLKQK